MAARPVPFYDRDALKAELIRDEGLKLKVYRCTEGKLSIGVGRNLDDVGIRATEEARWGITKGRCVLKGITRDEALWLLDGDVDNCEAGLDRKLPFWRRLDPVRQRVLLNMCFNMGLGTLLTFKNTLKHIEAGKYQLAADGMRASKWRAQVGERALRLARMMESGKC